ncbi:XylR family transcriptional regulator [Calycomorphotria hydatis]|uniref:Xylose operon regulatory protein n=1 Tax=Calycomorphotria hydatis TaxID=2528027 RepID=A0A517T456_9PLAN|nr:DNA-binding transcriptional regulator [Calycomorphotria hydatis]QDT63141.1 Xylose operon regulatory protein [Calycomorphotria hydatis]
MKRVALLIETSRSYGRSLLTGVRRYLAEHKHWSVFAELRDLETKPPPWLKNWDGDGILSRTGSPAMAKALMAVGVPTVELRATRFQTPFPFVGIDNQVIAQVAAEHLLQRGFRHFGVYAIDTEQFFEQRTECFVDIVRRQGRDCDVLIQPGHLEKPRQWEQQQNRLVRWLLELPKPVGILTSTDQLGFWLSDACRRANLSVPDEVAIVGTENDESLCEMSTPRLSSVHLDGERVGFEAASLLDKMMRGRRPPSRQLFFPPRGVITRQSSDIIAVEDPFLARALRLIQARACDGLRVDDILSEVPVSRSSLERGFRKLLGRSPNEEIVRVRLERSRELLLDTSLTLDDIARKTGFVTPQYFSNVFKKSFRESPGAYRTRLGK